MLIPCRARNSEQPHVPTSFPHRTCVRTHTQTHTIRAHTSLCLLQWQQETESYKPLCLPASWGLCDLELSTFVSWSGKVQKGRRTGRQEVPTSWRSRDLCHLLLRSQKTQRPWRQRRLGPAHSGLRGEIKGQREGLVSKVTGARSHGTLHAAGVPCYHLPSFCCVKVSGVCG